MGRCPPKVYCCSKMKGRKGQKQSASNSTTIFKVFSHLTINITPETFSIHTTRPLYQTDPSQGIREKASLQPLAWTHHSTTDLPTAKPRRCCHHRGHRHQPGLRPTGVLGIHKPMNIPSCTALKTLSQKRMKNSKAPETTTLAISSTQVCLKLIYCCCTSWTTEALPCCQTWKPHIRQCQSFSKIILWEAERLQNDSFETFPTVKKKKLDF